MHFIRKLADTILHNFNFTRQIKSASALLMGKVSDQRNNDVLSLYADSKSAQLYLKLIAGHSTEAKVSVIDMEGHTMLERNIPTNQLTFVPLNEISEGAYIAKVEFENNVVSQEFKF